MNKPQRSQSRSGGNDHISERLARDERSAARARELVRELIGRQARSASASGSASSSASGSASSSASPTSTGDAELVVSELVTNALRHGEGAIELRLALIEPERLVVEVVDEGDAADEVRRRAPDGAAPARERQGEAPGGWGLQIVDAVASRWGVFEGTTHVWAELSLGAP